MGIVRRLIKQIENWSNDFPEGGSWREGGSLWRIRAQRTTGEGIIVILEELQPIEDWHSFFPIKKISAATEQEVIDAKAKLVEWVHACRARRVRNECLAETLR